MKKNFLQFGAALLAFGLGLFSVQSARVLVDVIQILQKGVPVNPDTVEKEPVPEQKMLKIVFKDGTGSMELPDENYGRFLGYGRSCGKGGYAESYVTIDGDRLSEGAWTTTKKEFKRKISKAEKIIERIDGAKNRYDERGLRVIVKNLDAESGQEYYEILWYGKGILYFINAPSLELALEFEESNAYAY